LAGDSRLPHGCNDATISRRPLADAAGDSHDPSEADPGRTPHRHADPHREGRGAGHRVLQEGAGRGRERALPRPGGLIMHAEIKIGDSILFLSDEMPGMGNKSPQTLGGVANTLQIYTEDCDALFNRAVQAGAKATMPMTDMFWGDR